MIKIVNQLIVDHVFYYSSLHFVIIYW